MKPLSITRPRSPKSETPKTVDTTRRDKLLFWTWGIFLLLLLSPALIFVFWVVLLGVAWYIRKIPERKLPLARIFPSQPPRFYNWLSDFTREWGKTAGELVLILLVMAGLPVVVFSLRILPLPQLEAMYGAMIQVKGVNNGAALSYTTDGLHEPYCFTNLRPGPYLVTRINPPGWTSTTPDGITATLPSGGWTSVLFGATNKPPEVLHISSGQYASSARAPATATEEAGTLCVLAWADMNANGIRDVGELLIPTVTVPPGLLVGGAVLLYLLLIGSNLAAFYNTKYTYWDITLWQAEPTARLLVGGEEEFAKLSEAEKKKLFRHVAEAEIGINKATWIVSAGKASVVNAPAGAFARLGGPGVLVVQEGHAVVTERQGVVSGLKTAGLHFLKPFERVSLVVYLALQNRACTIRNIVTKDNIIIESLDVFVFYRADMGDQSAKSGMYRFDPKIVLRKIWTPKGATTPDLAVDFAPKVEAIANTAVRDVVAQYNLAEVITAAGSVRQEIKDKIIQALNRVVQERMGIIVTTVDMGAIVFPSDAQSKLFERWKIDWEAEIARIRAESDKFVAVTEAEGSYHTTIAKAEADKIAKIAKGEGERIYQENQGLGKAAALHATKFAEAEGEAEKFRQVMAAFAQRQIDDRFWNLLMSIVERDAYRNFVLTRAQATAALREPAEASEKTVSSDAAQAPEAPAA